MMLLSISIAAVAILAAGLAYYAWQARTTAEINATKARTAERKAIEKQNEADIARQQADTEAAKAQKQAELETLTLKGHTQHVTSESPAGACVRRRSRWA